MKKGILIAILCFAFVASFAQTAKKKKAATKKKPTTTKQQVVKQPEQQQPNLGKVPGTITSATPTKIDTGKKPVKLSANKIDRPIDGYYKKSNILSAKVTPYPNLRESDVAFSKRIWREIDLREKMNQYLGSPKQRLIDVIMSAIQKGELTAYDATPRPDTSIYKPTSTNADAVVDPDGDSFGIALTKDEAKAKLAQMNDSTVVHKIDKDGNDRQIKMAAEISPDSVVRFMLKEDWVFDRQRSMFEPRIIGLAPMIRIKIDKNAYSEYQPAFWIYFPDARPILATKEVVSRSNDNTGLSFDDVFMKRIFTSFIVKESNDLDRNINAYKTGIEKLYESERIKKSLQDWEISLWQY